MCFQRLTVAAEALPRSRTKVTRTDIMAAPKGSKAAVAHISNMQL